MHEIVISGMKESVGVPDAIRTTANLADNRSGLSLATNVAPRKRGGACSCATGSRTVGVNVAGNLREREVVS